MKRSAAASAGLVLWASMAYSQERIAIDVARGASCAGCTIELAKVASLGSAKDPEQPHFVSRVAIDGAGRFIVRSGSTKSGVLAYDAKGGFLRVVGRRGEGPGEYNVVTNVANGLGDSVLIVHEGFKVTVLTPMLQYARTALFPGILVRAPIQLPNGRWVMSNPGRTPASAGYPIHLVNREGSIESSFGVPSPTATPNCSLCDWRNVATGKTPGMLWSVPWNAYVVEEWTSSGELRRRITVTGSAWFRQWSTWPAYVPSPYRERPLTRLETIAESAEGQLWIAGTMAAADWKQTVSGPAGPTGSSRGGAPIDSKQPMVADDQYATVIDVIDPATARLVASRRFEHVRLNLISASLAYSVREDPTDGFAVLDVWRLRIKQP